jgi:hypothetical protein
MQRVALGPVLGAGVLACSLLVACASAPHYVPKDVPASVLPAQAKVGDFWEYAVRDAYTGFSRGVYRYEVTRADADNVAIDVLHDNQRVDAFVYAPGWNAREMPLTNLQRFRFEPPFPAYAYPLEPGKSWYTVVNATDPATRKNYRVHIQAKVTGWERVRVGAGELDALRIQRYVYAGNAESFNLQEEITQTDWYAPAVRNIVRSEASSSHIDTSRSGRGGPLRVRGDWLIAELTRYSLH